MCNEDELFGRVVSVHMQRVSLIILKASSISFMEMLICIECAHMANWFACMKPLIDM